VVTGLENELEGITVISVEQAVAGPYCGMLLADAGARVIKIERPGGDFARIYDRWAEGESAIFIWLNRGKESICLDIKSDEDMALLQNMAAKADVLLSNLAPGAMERYGLIGAQLRKANPGLITCMLSGYGRDGKAGRKKAYDFLVQAESGVVAVTGTPEEPVRVGISMTDLSTGLTAFSAILRALHQRHRTGKGVDMFDVMTDWMNMALLGYRYSDVAPQRYGLTHGFVAPYGAYQSKDGRQVMLSIQNDREWSDFCLQVLRQPNLVEDPRYKHNPERYKNRVALAEIINAVFAAYDKDDIIEMLEDTRIACASLNSVAEVSEHEFLQNRTVQMGDKIIDIADLPVRRAAGSVTCAPVLDEHGAMIRKEFS
jgi:formyl-CoA transferase